MASQNSFFFYPERPVEIVIVLPSHEMNEEREVLLPLLLVAHHVAPQPHPVAVHRGTEWPTVLHKLRVAPHLLQRASKIRDFPKKIAIAKLRLEIFVGQLVGGLLQLLVGQRLQLIYPYLQLADCLLQLDDSLARFPVM